MSDRDRVRQLIHDAINRDNALQKLPEREYCQILSDVLGEICEELDMRLKELEKGEDG